MSQSQNEASPRPWKVTSRRVVERPVRIMEHFALSPEGGPTFAFLPAGKDSRVDIQEANAALIVKAVNSYDRTREALAELSEWVTHNTSEYPIALINARIVLEN